MKRRFFVAAVMALITATTACTIRVGPPDLSPLSDGLSLTVAAPSQVPLRGTGVLAVTLTNISDRRLSACLGAGHGYHLFGVVRDFGNAGITDHAVCVTPFSLAPGESTSWSDSIEVGDIGVGLARLHYFVQIVSNKGCDRLYGCYAIHISAPTLQVQVVAPGTSTQK